MTDAGTLEAVDRILNRGGDPDELVAAILGVLVARGVAAWAALEHGPSAGGPRPADPEAWPIAGAGGRRLLTSRGGDRATLERVAPQLAPLSRGGAPSSR